MTKSLHIIITAAVLSAALFAQTRRPAPSTPTRTAYAPSSPIPLAPDARTVSAAHVVYYSPDEVPTIYTKLRFATAIVFPDSEKIAQVVCGDPSWWQIVGPDRIVYVKPSRAGISTNITVIGTSGNIYEFLLQEITPIPGVAPPPTDTPYVKVTVQLGETSAQRAIEAGPKYVSKTEMDAALEAAEQRVQAANEETRAMRANAVKLVEQETTRLRTSYPAALRFNYEINLHTPPFQVRAIYTDGKFTYLQLDSAEAPAIYEIRDGKPNLVAFDFVDGVFIVRKVLEQGYLAIGKAKLPFGRTKGR